MGAPVTAHELARKLLEGPDHLVVYFNEAYDETTTESVDSLDHVTLWQVAWNDREFDGGLCVDKPQNEKLTVRSIEAVRLR